MFEQKPASECAAIILAAGYSSRMEQGFKPFLPLPFADGQRNAIEQLSRLYRDIGSKTIILVYGEREKANLEDLSYRLGLVPVHNPDTARGMFSSVCVGLRALAPASSCFIHPADIPLVRPLTLHALCKAASPESVCIPTYQGQEGHPPFLPPRACAEVLAWAEKESQPNAKASKLPGGLRGALHALPKRFVPVPDSHVLLDMDTDADYATACSLAKRAHLLSPDEARELLACHHVPPRGLAHAEAVGQVAHAFALALQQCPNTQSQTDENLALAGGLLHDVCKGESGHEMAAGALLRRIQLPDLAPLVEDHRDMTPVHGAALTERELIYLADKYVHCDKAVSLEARFGQKLARHAHDAAACAAINRRLGHAQAMEAKLELALNTPPFTLARAALARANTGKKN